MASLTPDNIPALHHILLQSVNADPKTQKAAEAELEGLTSRPGYCSCLLVRMVPHVHRNRCSLWHDACLYFGVALNLSLTTKRNFVIAGLLVCGSLTWRPCQTISQEILQSASTDLTARWMAVLQLKNTIGKQWRRGLPGYEVDGVIG